MQQLEFNRSVNSNHASNHARSSAGQSREQSRQSRDLAFSQVKQSREQSQAITRRAGQSNHDFPPSSLEEGEIGTGQPSKITTGGGT
ncbi:hypothetical protein [Dactylosporangium sucinum]|uniref:hypothetical protein n=1 Tax=Dactylosporangium sucinum TaxID=1424081 RepID=UPI00167D9166|nr:hypothetical protein [Dactylosporangium sucinum]